MYSWYFVIIIFFNDPQFSVEKVEAMRYKVTYYSHPAGSRAGT